MKNYWRGLSLCGTAQYLVEKVNRNTGELMVAECITGDNHAGLIAENQKMLAEKLIKHLVEKGAILTCQECGHHGKDVKVVGDFHEARAICPSCLEKHLNRNKNLLKMFKSVS